MAAKQRSLFDDPGNELAITPQALSTGQRLTKRQHQFNRLTARLQQLRAELATWQRVEDRYRQHVAARIMPMQRELLAEQRAAVLFVDSLLASSTKRDGLSRTRKRKLGELAVSLAGSILEDGDDPEIAAIFARHSGVSVTELRRDQFEFTEVMLDAALGDDFMEGHTAKSVEELLEQAKARFDAQIESGPEKQRERRQARGARGKQAKPERDGDDASQSVRDLFRRLAAALHPDREQDDARRERKTALMQRVNQAYKRNDLLELLTVQCEVEEIDADHLARASDERLRHYCAVLQDQERALEGELAMLQMPFRSALDLDPRGGALRPQMIDLLMEQDVTSLRAVIDDLRRHMEALRDPARRKAAIDGLELDGDEPDFEAVLAEMLQTPPAPRRKRKSKR